MHEAQATPETGDARWQLFMDAVEIPGTRLL